MAGKRAPKGVTVDDLIELLNGDEQLAQLSKTRMKAELVGRVHGKIVDEYFATSATRQRLAKPGKLDTKYLITAPPKSFQIDVANYQAITAVNPSLVLNIIDILSRKLWAFPLKNNTMPTVLSTYKKFLKSIGLTAKPKHTGWGTSPGPKGTLPAQVSVRLSMVEGNMQFAAQEFTSYNDSKQIATYVDAAKYDHITPGGDRLGIVDRVTGTIRRKLELQYARKAAGTSETWQELVGKVVKAYNDEQHGTLARVYHVKRMTPNQAWELDADLQLARYSQETAANEKEDAGARHWTPGERIRILEYRGGKLGNNPDPYWSRGSYTVSRRDGYKYYVKDSKGDELVRRFRNTELKAVPTNEREDDAGLQTAKENRQRATARRTVKEREQIAPDENVLAGPEAEALRGLPADREGKTLMQLKPKRGQWIIIDAEGQADDRFLLRFKKLNAKDQQQTCYVWTGKVTKVGKKDIKLQYLASTNEDHKLSSRKLTLESGEEPLDGATPAKPVLYLGPLEWAPTARGKGSLPKDVVELVKQRYDTAAPEQ